MPDAIQMMFLPLLACLVFTGIHAYLGIHILERQVIFVDLALAQIAALGMIVSLLLGHTIHGAHAYWMSVLFTLVGAGIFALTRFRKQRIPQEAIIGMVYVVSAALLILILSRFGEGGEMIRRVLTGSVLLVGPDDIKAIVLIYSAVGLLHFFCRGQFFLISQNPAEAFERGLKVRLWDFLFYLSFGFVVTSSVKIAGVLLVFTFLVMPASCAFLFSDKTPVRVMLAWAIGAAASFTGIAASFAFDLPTGESVICVFGLFVLLSGISYGVRTRH